MNILKLNSVRVQRLYYSTRPWSNTYLRKLKKPQLESLARDNNLSPKGTKAQLITRLLDHQPASIHKQDNTRQPQSQPQPQPQPSPAAAPAPAPVQEQEQARTEGKNALEDDDSLDPQRWMESFELKVNQKRRTREAKTESFFPGSNTSPQRERKKVTPPPAPEDIPEDMDLQWVKALEQKAANRSMRIRTDTLHASDTSTDDLVSQLHENDTQRQPQEQPQEQQQQQQQEQQQQQQQEQKQQKQQEQQEQQQQKQEQKQKQEQEQQEQPPSPAVSNEVPAVERPTTQEHQGESSSSERSEPTEPRSDFTTAAVGSGLLLWYVSGANGFHSLVNWVTGSSA